MSEELARYQEAVDVARAELFALATLGGITSIGNVQAKEALAKINAITNPPPEMEDVEIVRWECGCGHVHKTAEAPKICNGTCGDGWCNSKGPFTKLTGTVKRPVKRPVVREVEAKQVRITEFDDGTGTTGKTISVHNPTRFPFADFDECHGKTGTLIFRWTDN